MYTISDLFDLSHTIAADYLRQFTYPWEALDGIGDFIASVGRTLDENEYTRKKENVWIHKSAHIFPSAHIEAPCIIGPGTQVRHCAFVRGSALVGEGCVVGNSVELKNVILFDCVETPHYNYVGDSILGFHSHMGAGSVTSNVKSDRKNIVVRCKEERFETGRRKFGAALGDFAEIGCNAVLNPGTIIGRNSRVYPTSCVRGVVPANSIWKDDGTVSEIEEMRNG